MKIVLCGRFNSYGEINGMTKFSLKLFEGLVQCGQEVVFLEYFFDGKKYGYIKKLFGHEKVLVNCNSIVLRLGVIPLIIFIIRNKVRFIHIVTYETYMVIFFVFKKIMDIKILTTLHALTIYESEFENKKRSLKVKILEKLLYEKSDYLVFLSPYQIKKAKEYYKIDAKTEFISHGCDRIAEIEFLPLNSKLKIFFSGGIERKVKGLDLVISALSNINYEFDLYVCGLSPNGISKYMLNSHTENFTIFYKGHLDEQGYFSLLHSCDLVCIPSYFETFSITLLEAMSSGKIIIVNNYVGATSYISNMRDGFIVEENTISQWENILKMIFNMDKKNLDQIRRNAVIKSKQFLSWNEVARKYIKLYQKYYVYG